MAQKKNFRVVHEEEKMKSAIEIKANSSAACVEGKKKIWAFESSASFAWWGEKSEKTFFSLAGIVTFKSR